MLIKTVGLPSASLGAGILSVGLLFSGPAPAEVYGGVNFPGGAASFADSVVSYDPLFSGGPAPAVPFRDTAQALGTPDGTYLSLGSGGRVVLQFTDNALTGSGNADLDLWVFEVGPDVEDTFVDVSEDGSNWFSVGKVFGATSGIDLDAFGFGIDSLFSFIRLTDDPAEGDATGRTVGADIDAVGAISSAPPVTLPAPGSAVLVALGLAAAYCYRRRPSSGSPSGGLACA